MNYMFMILDALIIAAVYYFMFASFGVPTLLVSIVVILSMVLTLATLSLKQIYKIKNYKFKDYYKLFEGVAVAFCILSIANFIYGTVPMVIIILLFNSILIYALMVTARILTQVYENFFHKTKNVLSNEIFVNMKMVSKEQDGTYIIEDGENIHSYKKFFDQINIEIGTQYQN